jgi:hypothetical protein
MPSNILEKVEEKRREYEREQEWKVRNLVLEGDANHYMCPMTRGGDDDGGCVGQMCMMWRFVQEPAGMGYCGFAGTPWLAWRRHDR